MTFTFIQAVIPYPLLGVVLSRTFKCDVCGKAFKTKGARSTHQKSHEKLSEDTAQVRRATE